MTTLKSNSNNNSCFVIMPFSERHNQYYNYILKPAVEELGISIIRADEIYGTESIINDIFDSISNASFLIADVTGKNPNVNYELGVAHALQKPVIIISKSLEDIPFDYRHRRVIIYDVETINWQAKLSEMIKLTIKQILKEVESEMFVPTINSFMIEHLNKTYSFFNGVISKESEIFTDKKGDCLIKQTWTIDTKTQFTHLRHSIFIDKPGTIEIIKIKDLLNGENLNFVIYNKTNKSLHYFILLNDIKPENSVFQISVELKAENYLSDLFDKRKGHVFHRNTRDSRISFLNKREKYIFPLLTELKNLKATYVNNPNNNTVIKSEKAKKKKDNYILDLDFGGVSDSNDEYGAMITY